MVGKLFKHEFKYYLKSFFLFLPFLFVLAAVSRLLSVFDQSILMIQIVTSSSNTIYIFGCVAFFILSIVLPVTRFDKNLFSQEGYLTFTLPVTYHQLLIVKIVTGFAVIVSSVLTIFLSSLIIIPDVGDVFHLIGTLFQFSELISAGKTGLAVITMILFFIAVIVYGIFAIMLFYTCSTIGQTSKKNRGLMGVLTFFGYYAITQVISTICILIITALSASNFEFINAIVQSFIDNPFTIYLWIFIGMIIIYGAQIVLFYFVMIKIFSKKLNLD